MLELEDPRWLELGYCQGSDPRIVEFLREMQAQDFRHLEWVSDAIVHQFTLYDGSFAVIPHLVRFAESAEESTRIELLAVIALVEVSRVVGPQLVVEEGIAAYKDALQRARNLLPPVVGALVEQGTPDAMTTLAVLGGFPLIGELLQCGADCPECEFDLGEGPTNPTEARRLGEVWRQSPSRSATAAVLRACGFDGFAAVLDSNDYRCPSCHQRVAHPAHLDWFGADDTESAITAALSSGEPALIGSLRRAHSLQPHVASRIEADIQRRFPDFFPLLRDPTLAEEILALFRSHHEAVRVPAHVILSARGGISTQLAVVETLGAFGHWDALEVFADQPDVLGARATLQLARRRPDRTSLHRLLELSDTELVDPTVAQPMVWRRGIRQPTDPNWNALRREVQKMLCTDVPPSRFTDESSILMQGLRDCRPGQVLAYGLALLHVVREDPERRFVVCDALWREQRLWNRTWMKELQRREMPVTRAAFGRWHLQFQTSKPEPPEADTQLDLLTPPRSTRGA